MDEAQLKKEGIYKIFDAITKHTEIPGCSLCMGNQARVSNNATVVSTSTRNFPDRLGDNANVYLSSAEVAAITAKLGHIPTKAEYLSAMRKIQNTADDIYKYLNFDKIADYQQYVGHIALDTILKQ
jgi:aconitate hydratase 2/2-methylisocitrate dehydratase